LEGNQWHRLVGPLRYSKPRNKSEDVISTGNEPTPALNAILEILFTSLGRTAIIRLYAHNKTIGST
jgi:hypothetical protein